MGPEFAEPTMTAKTPTPSARWKLCTRRLDCRALWGLLLNRHVSIQYVVRRVFQILDGTLFILAPCRCGISRLARHGMRELLGLVSLHRATTLVPGSRPSGTRLSGRENRSRRTSKRSPDSCSRQRRRRFRQRRTSSQRHAHAAASERDCLGS